MMSKEESCVDKCTDKFMKHSARAGLRFAEASATLQEKQLEMHKSAQQ